MDQFPSAGSFIALAISMYNVNGGTGSQYGRRGYTSDRKYRQKKTSKKMHKTGKR